MVSVRKSE